MGKLGIRIGTLVVLCLSAWVCGTAVASDGALIHGAGPVNEAMGGAGTATTIEPIAAIAWNPGAMPRLRRGWTVGVGVGWAMPDQTLESTAGPLAGSSASGLPDSPLPSLAVLYNPRCSRWGFHFGTIGYGALGVRYPADPSNPITRPQGAGGFGEIRSEYLMLRMPLGVSYRASNKLSLGLSVTPATATFQVIPASFATPNPDGTYPLAHARSRAWGVGVQVGAHYQINRCLAVGASYSSPTWFQDYEWNTVDHVGAPRRLTLDLDFPAVASVGVAWQATRRTLLAADVRWIDYNNTDGFGAPGGFAPAGNVDGLGWNSILCGAFGIRQQIGRCLHVMGGYHYCENPVPDSLSFFSVSAPAVVQHRITAGASYRLSRKMDVNVAAWHVFEGTGTGPWYDLGGAVPATSATNKFMMNGVNVGVTLNL